MKTNIKSQVRWLLFLLIPFLSMLVIHFITPLQMVLNTLNPLQEAFNIQKFNLEQNSIRSHAETNQQILSNYLQKYYHLLNTFQQLDGSNTYCQMQISNSLKLNNAYEFYQQSLELNSSKSNKQQKSMWFATNIIDFDQMTPFQKSIILAYSKIESYIQAQYSFFDNTSLLSAFTIISQENDSIIIQFPSTAKINYENLSSPALNKYYFEFYQRYRNSNRSVILAPSVDEKQNLVILCHVISYDNYFQTNCLTFNLKLFAQQVRLKIDFFDIDYTINTYRLVEPIYNKNETSPRILLTYHDNTSLNNYIFNEQFQIFNQEKAVRLFSAQPRDYYLIEKLQKASYLITPIIVNKDNQKNTILYLIIESITKVALLSNQKTFETNINVLIIPISIIIAVASIISLIIMKKLLNSIEDQMYQLNQRCNFIVKGDTDIDIPTYTGTKDIYHVYESVKIINKLHRYSTNTYFTGHFSNKILKYVEALQVINKLGYNPGCLIENIGQCYLYIEQFDLSIKYLKESIDLLIKQIEQEFGTIEEMYNRKKIKIRTSHRFKQLEVILIRRLFKICFTYFKYLDLQFIIVKVDGDLNTEDLTAKKERLVNQLLIYIGLLKKSFYPDFATYSEFLMISIMEAKQKMTIKKLDQARQILTVSKKILNIYTDSYADTTNKLKEKGSKNKFFHQKQKLTYHSRIRPQIIKLFWSVMYGKLLQLENKNHYLIYNEVFDIHFSSLKQGHTTLSMNFLTVLELRRIMIVLGINIEKWESTQIFREFVPFKALHYGPITKENQPQLLKNATKTSPGLEREFIYLIDCSKSSPPQEKNENYLKQRMNYIFSKLIKPTDRLSIVKFNSVEGIKIECNLILKQSSTNMLLSEIEKSFDQKYLGKFSHQKMIESIHRTILRIKNLKSRKVIIIFFKSIDFYKNQLSHIHKKLKKKRSVSIEKSEQPKSSIQLDNFSGFGEDLINLMAIEGLRNTQICLFCGVNDKHYEFKKWFGLQNINKRIWSNTGGLNKLNNVVYVIDEKHKVDIDRILSLKTQDIPDNHVFIL